MSNTPATMNTPSRSPSAPPLLSVAGISVRFAGVKALTDISFHVLPGELFAVIRAKWCG